VLFVSGLQIYPTLSGGHLRSFALANALHRRGLEVFVYSMVGRKKEYLRRRRSSIQAWPEGIQEYVDRRALGFVAQWGSYLVGLPPVWLTAYLEMAALAPGKLLLPTLLREKLAWCDVVVADFPFVHPIFSVAPPGRLRVLSTHNLEHQMHDEQGGPRDRRLRAAVRRIELEAAGACDILVSCCDDDRRFFEAKARVRESVLVPNGIDPRRFRGIEGQRSATRRALGIPDDVKVFLFTASKWGPNREALDYLLAFAKDNPQLLAGKGIHILVAGSVVAEPVRFPGFTATGRVDSVEPYFAAADAALNPMSSGAGTNVKMCEFIAMRLPIVSTPFGARGFLLEDGRTGFLFAKDRLAEVLSTVRRLFDDDPVRLRRMAEEAYARNEDAIDMDSCVRPLVEAIAAAPERSAHLEPAPLLRTHARSE
jgi:glycosyltransferase involved in cell wall biosynthesis